MDDSVFMLEALKEARVALDSGELPIGAVLVYNGQIMVRSHNQVAGTKDLTCHAEYQAFIEFKPRLTKMPLRERRKIALYTTLEPCMLCLGMSMCWNIGRLYYALESPGDGVISLLSAWTRKSQQLPNYTPPAIVEGVCRETSALMFEEFATKYPTSRFANWARDLCGVIRGCNAGCSGGNGSRKERS